MSGIYRDQARKFSAKTANYTLTKDDIGIVITNRGATGAVTCTLPALADISAGWFASFFVVADQSFTVTAPANKLTAFNNATATSIAFSTSAEKIGGGVTVEYDGTTYLAHVELGIETQTPTIS